MESFLIKRTLKYSALFLLMVFIAAIAYAAYLFFWPPGSKLSDPVVFKIKWGASVQTISTNLEEQRVIKNANEFMLVAKLLGKSTSFKAGLFTLEEKSSNYKVINALLKGPQSYIKVTIPEGVTSRQIASIMTRKMEVDSIKFLTLVNDDSLVKELGIEASTLEGFLYPETYNMTYGVSEKQIITTLVRQFHFFVTDTLQDRAKELGYTMQEIVTLASIIEGEAMLNNEMDTISSVYHNRLGKGMRLQADPTIQYIIADGPRRLLNRDLEIDSPYNTYKYSGLPPGPINNPSIHAIRAALYPAETRYLYFVANGDGSHTFSATLKQHLNAKRKFDQIRQQVARQKRSNN